MSNLKPEVVELEKQSTSILDEELYGPGEQKFDYNDDKLGETTLKKSGEQTFYSDEDILDEKQVTQQAPPIPYNKDDVKTEEYPTQEFDIVNNDNYPILNNGKITKEMERKSVDSHTPQNPPTAPNIINNNNLTYNYNYSNENIQQINEQLLNSNQLHKQNDLINEVIPNESNDIYVPPLGAEPVIVNETNDSNNNSNNENNNNNNNNNNSNNIESTMVEIKQEENKANCDLQFVFICSLLLFIVPYIIIGLNCWSDIRLLYYIKETRDDYQQSSKSLRQS